jgi:predicted amidohydrolase YtcJ
MAADVVLTAQSVITMDLTCPRAQAIAIDSTTGTIVAVGTLAECQAAAPGVTVTDLGDTVLLPGFIEAHSHPAVSGLATEPPCHWISRAQNYANYAQVQELWHQLDSTLPAGVPVMCWGLDRMGQGAPELTNTDLDAFFPTRPAAIFDISGHEAYFNSATIALNGWAEGKPPADPPAARFGRNAVG